MGARINEIVTTIRYLLHDDADVVGVEIMTHAQEQLDVLMADASQSLNVVGDAFHQLFVTGAPRMNLHIAVQGAKVHTLVTQSFKLDCHKWPVLTVQYRGQKYTHNHLRITPLKSRTKYHMKDKRIPQLTS